MKKKANFGKHNVPVLKYKIQLNFDSGYYVKPKDCCVFLKREWLIAPVNFFDRVKLPQLFYQFGDLF